MKYKKSSQSKYVISVRDFSRNFSYFIDRAQDEPIFISKRGNILAMLTTPKTPVKKSPKKLSDLAFFKDFVEPTSWKKKTSLQIATELRERAWYGK